MMRTLNFYAGQIKKAFALITNTDYNQDGKYSVQVLETTSVSDLEEYGFDEYDFAVIDNLGVGESYRPEPGVILNRLA